MTVKKERSSEAKEIKSGLNICQARKRESSCPPERQLRGRESQGHDEFSVVAGAGTQEGTSAELQGTDPQTNHVSANLRHLGGGRKRLLVYAPEA